MPITLTTPTDYFVIGRTPAATLLLEWGPDVPLPSAGDPLRTVWFERVGSWYNRAESIDMTFSGKGSIDANDLDGWLADNAVIAERLGDTTVGGRAARTVDVRPDPAAGVTGECLPVFKPCIWVSTLSGQEGTIEHHPANAPLGSGFVARMWLVDMDGMDPVLVRINAPDDDLAWLDEFEQTVLPTITFGEPTELAP